MGDLPLYIYNTDTIEFVPVSKIMDKLYYLEVSLPTMEQVKKSKKEINDYFKTKDDLLRLRDLISLIDNKIPLYDSYTQNLYLIDSHDVYNKVVREHYRNLSNDLVSKIKLKLSKLKNIKQLDPLGKAGKSSDIILKRRFKKMELIVKFANNFNIDLLEATYMKIFYKSAKKDITLCKRPSFIPYYSHTLPYYTRSELINLALNMQLIEDKDIDMNDEDLDKLCIKIQQHDINKDIILSHQNYIANENKIGLVQYYSFVGSGFINYYLRGGVDVKWQNRELETLAKSMHKLCINSPVFDKDYIVYRFVESDEHILHLEVGDTYKDSAFISTTRNPFYKSQNYEFGLILIKIIIPKNKKGMALCIEPYSFFKEEQEIIIPAGAVLKLTNRNENVKYYHTDIATSTNIKTKYEFKLTKISNIEFPSLPPISKNDIIDFLELEQIDAKTIVEKIEYFTSNVLNENNQVDVVIDKQYTLLCNNYDSTQAYKNMFAINTNNGFMIYSIYDNHVIFMIEIGVDIHVNYYFKNAVLGSTIVDDDKFLNFIATVAYYFKVQNVYIYANYKSCDITKNSIYTKYNYDIYIYLKNEKKRFDKSELNKSELHNFFSYSTLDDMLDILPSKLLYKYDRDELYQYYNRIYLIEKKPDNIKDFFIWIIENYCEMYDILITKFERYFKDLNPLSNDIYRLDALKYLYNKKLIRFIPRKITVYDTKKAKQPLRSDSDDETKDSKTHSSIINKYLDY